MCPSHKCRHVHFNRQTDDCHFYATLESDAKKNFPLGVNLKKGTRMMIDVVDLEIKKKMFSNSGNFNASEVKTSNNHTSQVLKTEVIMLTMNVNWKITKFEARLCGLKKVKKPLFSGAKAFRMLLKFCLILT